MDDRSTSGNVDAQPPFFCARAARTPATNCSLVTFTANPLSDRKNAARGTVILPSPVVSTAPCGVIALTFPITPAPPALRTSSPGFHAHSTAAASASPSFTPAKTVPFRALRACLFSFLTLRPLPPPTPHQFTHIPTLP